MWSICGRCCVSWIRLHNKLTQRHAFRVALQELLAAGAVVRKGALGCFDMGVDLPAAGEQAVLPMMPDEPLHILQRVAEEDADFVGEAGGVRQPCAQVVERCADGEGRVAQGQQKALHLRAMEDQGELLWPEEVEQLFLCLRKHHKAQAGKLGAQVGQVIR